MFVLDETKFYNSYNFLASYGKNNLWLTAERANQLRHRDGVWLNYVCNHQPFG